MILDAILIVALAAVSTALWRKCRRKVFRITKESLNQDDFILPIKMVIFPDPMPNGRSGGLKMVHGETYQTIALAGCVEATKWEMAVVGGKTVARIVLENIELEQAVPG